MSISRMKHIVLAAHNSVKDDLLYKLSWLSCLEVKPYDKLTVENADELKLDSDFAKISEFEKKLDTVSTAINLCEQYDRTKKKLLTPQTYIDRKTLAKAKPETDTNVGLAVKLSRQINELKTQIAECTTEISALEPYVSYDAPLGENTTKYTRVLLGNADKGTDIKEISDGLDGISAYVMDIGTYSERPYFALFVHKDETNEALKVLSQYGFIQNEFDGEKLTAAKKISELKAKCKSCSEQLGKAQDEAVRMSEKYLSEFKEEYDRLSAKLGIEQLKAKLPTTESCVIIEGWYPEQKEKKLFSLLEKYPCCYETREAYENEEDVPVLLSNNKFSTPFESVVSLYSLPNYHGIDATTVMSLFYFVTFGLMFADVGYGLILILGGFLGPLLMKSKESTKKFLNLFGICGISCVIAGVCFNGYFGDLPQKIAENWFGVENFPDLAIFFSPLSNPMPFLVLGLVIGVVQVLFGMALSGYMQIKRGHPLDALFDVGSWYLLIFGLLGLALGSFIDGMPETVAAVSKWLAVSGVAVLVLTQGRREKNVIMKLLKGITSLYSLVNVLSDVLSYSRILALGLASSVIASVANLLATMGGPTPIGIIAFIIAFLLGHALNFGLNVLGTYVHTSRLQYIEFFGRFYEDGGREFAPVAIQTKYNGIIYKEEK